MNDIQVNEIKTALYGLQYGFMHLDVMTNIYESGKIKVGIIEIPLTESQKTQVKTACETLTADLKNTADGLESLTGKTGVIQKEVRENIISQPRIVTDLVNKHWQRLGILLQMEPTKQADGTYRIEIPEEAPQDIADSMAQIKEGTSRFCDVLGVKLEEK